MKLFNFNESEDVNIKIISTHRFEKLFLFINQAINYLKLEDFGQKIK